MEQRKKRKLAQYIPGIFFSLVLAGGLCFTLIQPINFTGIKGAKLFSGEWMSRYQQRYESKFGLHDFAEQTWGFIRYFFFREGWPGVLVGKDGWLFTSEEFSYYPTAARQTEENLAYIQAARQRLAARQIELVIALVPDKARIYRDHLGRYQYPAYAAARYQDFRHKLLALGILAPDLEAALTVAKSREQVWLRGDTHWSAAGACVAAETLAAVIKPLLAKHQDVPRGRFRLFIPEAELYEGDLARFIPLGLYRKLCRLKPDLTCTQEAVPLKTEFSRSSLGLFAAPQIPVTLVGTSYSAGKKWAFDAALEVYLESDVLNMAKEGLGSFLPMQLYLKSTTFVEVPPVLVIWEIPERYLSVAFPLN